MSSIQTSPQMTASSAVQRVPWWIFAFGAILVVAHLPLLAKHAEMMWNWRPHYQYFPLVPIGAAFLAWQRVGELGQLKPGSKLWSYLLVVSGFFLLTIAVLVESSWVAAVATLITLLAVIVGLGGWSLTKACLPAWIFLWMAVPLPLNLDERLIIGLQFFTARWSSAMLDLFGVLHVMAGNVVEVPGQKLLVEEACSGIHSLFAALTCTLFLVFWVGRPILHSILLLLAAVVWVLVANVVRVVGVTILDTQFGIPVADGWPHEVFGLIIFAFTFGLILSTDRLLLFFTPHRSWFRRRADDEEAEPDRPEAPAAGPTVLPDLRSTWLGSWTIAGLYAVLIAGQFLLLRQSTFTPMAEPLDLEVLTAEQLPAQWQAPGGEVWAREGFTNQKHDYYNEGEHSQSWLYDIGKEHKASVSVDYPFVGFHDLSNCYKGNGWMIEDSSFEPLDPDNQASQFVTVKLVKSADRHGYLLFGIFDKNGRALQPQARWWRDFIWRAANIGRISQALGQQFAEERDLEVPSYQIQLFIESYAPMEPAEIEQAKTFYKLAAENLTRRWSQQPAAERAAQEAK